MPHPAHPPARPLVPPGPPGDSVPHRQATPSRAWWLAAKRRNRVLAFLFLLPLLLAAALPGGPAGAAGVTLDPKQPIHPAL